MPNITEFLEARIAEDEATARACDVPVWSIRDEPDEHIWVEGLSIHAADSNWDACIAVADARHAVRHDPSRVLAECAAKRAIMDGWEDPDSINGLTGDVDAGLVMGKDNAVRYLAAVYKDHPDYQQEWAV